MIEVGVGRAFQFVILSMALAVALPAGAEQAIIGEKNGRDIVTVRVTEAVQSKQALPIFTGISGVTAGAKHLRSEERRVGKEC